MFANFGKGLCGGEIPSNGAQVFLCTVQIQVLNKKGEQTTLRAMLDTGSQVEMISKNAADRLGWDIYGLPVSIRGIGGGELQRTHGQMDFTIMRPGGGKYKLTCHVLDKLVGDLSTTRLPASFMEKFQDYVLADPDFHTASHIDVLIGMGCYNDFVLPEREQIDCLWLLHTVLGWAVTGRPVKSKPKHPTPSVMQTNLGLIAGVCHDSDNYSPILPSTTDSWNSPDSGNSRSRLTLHTQIHSPLNRRCASSITIRPRPVMRTAACECPCRFDQTLSALGTLTTRQ